MDPRKPRRPKCLMTSSGKICCSSHSRTCEAISASANSRTVLRSWICSGVNSNCIRGQVKIWFNFSSLREWDVREQFEKRARDYRVVPFEVLGSFCNFVCGGQGWGVFAERGGEGSVDYGIGLKGFQLFEAAMEGSLDAGVVAGEPIELGGVLIAWIGFQQANPAQVPGGGDQFIEQCLLDGALGFDVGYKI